MTFLDKQFELGAETAAVWALSGKRLKSAGDLLFDAYASDLNAMGQGSSPLTLAHLEVVGPATLLLGLAMENVLKAIVIEKDPQPTVDGKLRDWGAGHDPIRLAERAGIALDKNQKDLLRRLGAFVEWAGRYPIPKKATKLAVPQLNLDRPFPPLPLQPDERPMFDALFNSLYSTVIREECVENSPTEAG